MIIKRRLGNIKYENKDTKPMNEQKKRFLYFRDYYINKGKNIATTIAVLDYLTTHREYYDNISTISPAFMSAVINNFWAQAVIDLYAFYYTKNDLSFNAFFDYITSNWNLIFTGDFYEYVDYGDETTTEHIKYSKTDIFDAIKNCQNLIEENKDKIDRLKVFRDNVFAHFGDLSKQKDAVQISIELLQGLLALTEQIINKIEVFYDRTATSLNAINATDISQTCYAISKFKEYRDEIHTFDLQKMNAKIGDQNEKQRN